jgi:hypothetical protein
VRRESSSLDAADEWWQQDRPEAANALPRRVAHEREATITSPVSAFIVGEMTSMMTRIDP